MLPLRVVFYQSSPQHLYGGQLDLLCYFEALDCARIVPHVITPGPGPFVERVQALGIDVTELPLPGELARTGGVLLESSALERVGQAAKLLPWSLRLARLLRRIEADVLYANNRRAVLTVGLAARLAHVPVFWHIKQDLARRRIDRIAFRLTTYAAGCSLDVQRAFQCRHPRHAARIGYVPNGIPVERFTAAGPDLRVELDIPASAPLIGLVGSITPRKGADLFVKSALRLAERHADAHFILAGDAPEAYAWFKNEILAAAQPLADQNRFHSPGRLDDMPALYRSLDLLALPSRVEGFGLVVAEAGAAGVPCVRSDSGGHSETTIDGETGFVVPIDDLDAFTDRLDRLLMDADLRRRMGEAAREHAVAHFTLDRFTDALTDALVSTALEWER